MTELSGRRACRKSAPSWIVPRLFTFGTSFIEGSATRHALVPSLSPSTEIRTHLHPLVIYGDCGLGKTHLMQAIGCAVKHHEPGVHARVQYRCTLGISEDHIRGRRCIQGNSTTQSTCSVLDDVQCVCLGTGAQAELLRVQADLLRTLDRLTERNSLIVMTAPCLPQEWSTQTSSGRYEFPTSIHDSRWPDSRTPQS
ncbi:MAG: hypothetical protein IPH41_15365 [Sulfuritalea sp.]|nr:hypothetical protein [Sulfuritalea sp.]